MKNIMMEMKKRREIKKSWIIIFMHANKTSLKIILLIIAAIVISGYAYYQAQALISGPKITIISPLNGAGFNDSLIEIKGNTENITHISLNDRTIFVDETGSFNEKLLIYKGLNIIEAKVVDKFGRAASETLKLVLK